jgi:hypothetical protein
MNERDPRADSTLSVDLGVRSCTPVRIVSLGLTYHWG